MSKVNERIEKLYHSKNNELFGKSNDLNDKHDLITFLVFVRGLCSVVKTLFKAPIIIYAIYCLVCVFTCFALRKAALKTNQAYIYLKDDITFDSYYIKSLSEMIEDSDNAAYINVVRNSKNREMSYTLFKIIHSCNLELYSSNYVFQNWEELIAYMDTKELYPVLKDCFLIDAISNEYSVRRRIDDFYLKKVTDSYNHARYYESMNYLTNYFSINDNLHNQSINIGKRNKYFLMKILFEDRWFLTIHPDIADFLIKYPFDNSLIDMNMTEVIKKSQVITEYIKYCDGIHLNNESSPTEAIDIFNNLSKNSSISIIREYSSFMICRISYNMWESRMINRAEFISVYNEHAKNVCKNYLKSDIESYYETVVEKKRERKDDSK